MTRLVRGGAGVRTRSHIKTRVFSLCHTSISRDVSKLIEEEELIHIMLPAVGPANSTVSPCLTGVRSPDPDGISG